MSAVFNPVAPAGVESTREPGPVASCDPALAAYAASRRAEAEMAAFNENGEAEAVWRAREDRLAVAQAEAREVAWAALPTTHAGRRALVEHARLQIGAFTGPGGKLDDPECLIGDMLGAFAAAVEAERPEFTPEHPDAALLALGLPFLAAWRDEGAAWLRCEKQDDAGSRATYDAAVLRRNDVTDRIVALPALTPEGLGIKALVLAGYVCTDYGPANPTAPPADEHPSGEGAVEWQIQTGAARILAGPDAGGRGAVSPLFDPASMPIAALAALYDAARGAAEHLDALGGGPGDPERVGVQAVLGGEAERLRGVMLACAGALAEREPRTPAERRARARVRAMHAVEVGAWADLAGLAIAEGSADREQGR